MLRVVMQQRNGKQEKARPPVHPCLHRQQQAADTVL